MYKDSEVYTVYVCIEHLLIVLYVHLFAEKYDGRVKVQDITVVILLSNYLCVPFPVVGASECLPCVRWEH